MSSSLKITLASLACVLVAVGALALWAAVTGGTPLRPGPGAAVWPEPQGSDEPGRVLRIGIIPERDIFRQRRRYKALAGYLSGRLDRPVKLVTARSYEAVLRDFGDKRIEGAFLGSFVAVLAMERHGGRVTVCPELPGGISTYRGVIFVRADSPISVLQQLSGKSLAMVWTTTAGHLFPVGTLARLGLWSEAKGPRPVRLGTHDEVAMSVMAGDVDAGAIKNLRLDALKLAHPEWQIRRLAEGSSVPNNALIMSPGVPDELVSAVTAVLLKMAGDPEGRRTLSALGATRFLPCRAEQYAHIHDMIDRIRPMWDQMGIAGPPPAPRGAPSTTAAGEN